MVKFIQSKSDAESNYTNKIKDREKDIKTLLNNKMENFKKNFIDKDITVWTIQEKKLKSWEFTADTTNYK